MRNFYLLTIAIVFILHTTISGQNIRINEFMSSNSASIADDDGDYSDWIELYNAGSSSVNIEGWGLSDNPSNPHKWVFPEYVIQPGEHLLVWASGKDRRPQPGEKVSGLLHEIYYNIQGSSIPNMLQHPDYPDNPGSTQILKDRFETPADVADYYGQRVHGLLKAPATGDYVFWISSDDHGQLHISTDENPSNLRLVSEVPGWTQRREWEKYPAQKSAPVSLEEGKLYYIMALMKEGAGGDHLSVRWQLPDGKMEEPMHLIHTIYDGPIPFHTNFSIDANGEALILTDKNGTRIDEISPQKLPADVSYGRTPDGSSVFRFFSAPTPGMPNNDSGFSEILEPPVFSHQGGFYSESFDLTISSPRNDVTIIYTIDGSEPTSGNLEGTTYQYRNQYRQQPGSTAGPMLTRSYTSFSYSSPIEIYDRSPEENQISSISTTFDSNPWYLPDFPVDKAIVVKARTEKEGAMPSQTVTHTFFINDEGRNPFTLPVISLAAQENYLFDYYEGIYTAGMDFENWRTANPTAEANGGSYANYKRNDMQWEHPGNFEYFDENGVNALNQQVGIRIHGGWSRANALKTLRIHARNIYGETRLDYPFFKDQEYNSYKRILLRNSGNDYWYTWFRDAAMQEMVRHMNFETQAYQPSIVYLNGEYWGIHNIRERFDKHYVARKFNLDGELVDMLDGNSMVETGNSAHYMVTLDYIRRNGLENSEHYDYINTRIDVESYIDFIVAETYLVNTDWPGNNLKYWRYRTDEYNPSAEPGKDGRWRWMMYDTDFGFALYYDHGFVTNMFEYLTDVTSEWPNPEWSTFLFRSLLQNRKFQVDFITRYSDQLNTAFIPEVVKPVIDRMKKGIEPEIEKHFERWKAPADNYNWNRKINVMYDFADHRPNYIWSHLKSFFQLEETYQLITDISDPSHGHIIVNTIPLKKETRGVSDNPYPWQGKYFKNLPLRLEAVPNSGYLFVRWEGNDSVYNNPVITINPENHQHFTAVFAKAVNDEELIHYWNFNDANNLLGPAYTLLTAKMEPFIASNQTGEITYDTGQGFAAANARFGNPAGSHLRINNPLGVSLVMDVPTTGFSQIKVKYETRRSGQGAGKQVVEYSPDGNQYIMLNEIVVEDNEPVVVLLDMGTIEAANNNPSLKIRISFEQAAGGLEGNNRFDNFTVEGIPEEGMNRPPQVIIVPEDINAVEGEDNLTIQLNEMFIDPEGDELTFTVDNENPSIVQSAVENGIIELRFLKPGASAFKITAGDGVNPIITVSFKAMVYPKPFVLANENFSFTEWNPDAPEITFPANMMFLQSDKDDPDKSEPLEFPYFIPAGDYAADDAGNIGFPYRNTRRTRITGWGEDGISFINTGRGRDVGGALVALDTRGLTEMQASWLAGTILRNERRYGLTVQYRTGVTGEFRDVSGSTYQAQEDGHTDHRGPVVLPSHLLNQEYVQLLWRYHHISGNSGSRDELRLDEIMIAAKPPVPLITHPQTETSVAEQFDIIWDPTLRTGSYDLQIADNPDFTNPVVTVTSHTDNVYQQNPPETGTTYYIRVRADNSGIKGNWSEVLVVKSTPTHAGLNENDDGNMLFYPNPFGTSATLQLNLSSAGQTDISIYDLSGRKVINIYNGRLPVGEQSFTINGNVLRPGTYLLLCQTEKGIFRSKIIKQ